MRRRGTGTAYRRWHEVLVMVPCGSTVTREFGWTGARGFRGAGTARERWHA